jgi:UrcA family protein
MNRKPLALRSNFALFAAVGALVGGSSVAVAPANAQQIGEVTVVAPHVVRQKAGTTASGIPIEVISLSRQVGYSDLDLTTASGVGAFKNRVMETAKTACAQLDQLYPESMNPPDPSNQNCVKAATDNGLAQVDLIMAAAAAGK